MWCSIRFLEAIKSVKYRYFTGDDQDGYIPYFGTLSVADGTVKAIGQLFAASLVNGGPAPAFFADWVYKFLIDGIMVALRHCPRQFSETSDTKLKDIYNQVIRFHLLLN